MRDPPDLSFQGMHRNWKTRSAEVYHNGAFEPSRYGKGIMFEVSHGLGEGK
jgi:hypothetical protein